MSAVTTVVIPNYNGIRYLDDCLGAMRRQAVKPDRVIVVDNGSTDGSAEYIRSRYPEAELIALPHNSGFCGAVNTGIRASAGADYVILLNNDTKADANFVGELVRAMEELPDAFSCQAKMLRMANPAVIDDAGDLYCALGWAFARGKGAPREVFTKAEEIFFSCAGAAIYRMKAMDAIGVFDEHHFAYLEDCDIGWRARISGYRNYYIPSARVLHVGSATSGSVYNLFKVKNTSRNSIYLISKNMPLPQILLNLPFLLPGFLIKALFFAVKGYGREYVKGIAHGFALSAQGRKEGRRVRFLWKNLPHYRKIQMDLWTNIPRRLVRR
ncbi:MAG: glycosyltransferase family 2 protein [Lachnospiraceae bacterium]|nr:glycosyltransferase family 2 protein [Lachnospiraceae bacterium]